MKSKVRCVLLSRERFPITNSGTQERREKRMIEKSREPNRPNLKREQENKH